MKHLSILSITLLTNIILHASQENKQLDFWHKDIYKKVSTTLNNVYETYVKNRLAEYKKTDFTQEDMDTIKKMATTFTGNSNLFKPSLYIKGTDEQNNNFIHIAIQKMDTTVFLWLMREIGDCDYYPCSKDNHYFMDQCIDQLSPKNNILLDKKYCARNTLEYLTLQYEGQLPETIRKPTLEKLIKLRIMLAQHNQAHLLKDIVFEQLLTPKEKTTEVPLDLATLYQQVANTETGNTLAHTLINLYDADGLYALLQKNYISGAPNKDTLTVLELALKNFQVFTQDPSQFELYPDKAQKTRCCLMMLMKYSKSKDNGYVTSLHDCCDKHLIAIKDISSKEKEGKA